MLDKIYTVIIFVAISVGAPVAMGATLLVEAESFDDKGGWEVDQQYMDNMGSPYLLAHGMGEVVADAVTTVSFPSTGTYKMWVRTKDWVPGAWDAPGRFEVLIDGTSVGTTFGTIAGWTWQDGGTIVVTDTNVTISLHDLTGFDGRCDAIYFDTNTSAVPADFDAENPGVNRQWRNGLLGLPATPSDAGEFDVVIVGGGIAGCGAALAADKEGLSVALIQDRPLLGGNASSEIRVHTLGIYGEGGDILELIDTEHYVNGSALALIDQQKRETNMAAATNITIFSSHRAYDVQMSGSEIVSVDACSVITGQALRFRSDVFIDCTGDGWIGYWAGADYRYGRESKNEFGEEWATHGDLWSPEVPDNRVMGSSLLWYSSTMGSASTFPEVPWAMDVALTHSATAGEWYWEYSDNEKHQIDDAEEIRDHMLRAIYGSFYNAKQSGNANKKLDFVGYLNGKRESRRLMGDYIYTQSDATSGTLFDDAVVQEIRSIDVHYQEILSGDSTVDFLSEALFKGVPRYYIPFRCLYSRNIDNLMMAGRDFSCSHVGLGGPRVMNTCGQMGIATGYAASLCKKYSTTPLGIYTGHIEELKDLVNNVEPGDPVYQEVMSDGFEAAEDLAGNGWSGNWNFSGTTYGNPANYIWSAGDKGITTKDTGYVIQSGDSLVLGFDVRDMDSSTISTDEQVIATLYYHNGVSNVVLGSVGYSDTDVPAGWNSELGELAVYATDESIGKNLMISFEFDYAGGTQQRFGIDNVLLKVAIAVPLTADNISTDVLENGSVLIMLSGTDPDGSILTYNVTSMPANGTLTTNGALPNLTYTPDTDFFGSDGFTYTVNNGAYDSAPATVSITVNEVVEGELIINGDFETNGGATGTGSYTTFSNWTGVGETSSPEMRNDLASGAGKVPGATGNAVIRIRGDKAMYQNFSTSWDANSTFNVILNACEVSWQSGGSGNEITVSLQSSSGAEEVAAPMIDLDGTHDNSSRFETWTSNQTHSLEFTGAELIAAGIAADAELRFHIHSGSINWIDNVSVRATTSVSDSDDDGMPDAWETANGLDPDVNDAMGDLDGDGKSNHDEYLADTKANDPNSKQNSSVTPGPGVDEMSLAFSTSSNRLYTVDYRDDLTGGDWAPFTSQFTGTGSETNFIDSAATNRFYRLQIRVP